MADVSASSHARVADQSDPPGAGSWAIQPTEDPADMPDLRLWVATGRFFPS